MKNIRNDKYMSKLKYLFWISLAALLNRGPRQKQETSQDAIATIQVKHGGSFNKADNSRK